MPATVPGRRWRRWVECLAGELEEKQGRNGKPKPSSLSRFEWALGNEQEREGEPVGARR